MLTEEEAAALSGTPYFLMHFSPEGRVKGVPFFSSFLPLHLNRPTHSSTGLLAGAGVSSATGLLVTGEVSLDTNGVSLVAGCSSGLSACSSLSGFATVVAFAEGDTGVSCAPSL